MKTFTQYITEMTAEEYIPDAKKAAEYFNTEIKKIFPDFIARAYVASGVGTAFHVEFVNVKDKSEAPMNIIRNVPGYMTFIMHLSTGWGKTGDMEKFSLEQLGGHHLAKKHGLVYRKISGKSPSDVIKKLIDWFKKNEKVLKDMPKDSK